MSKVVEQYGQNINMDFLVLNRENRHYLNNFSCGNTAIDNYFKKLAYDDLSTATYMFIDKDKELIIALVSLSCSKIDYFDGSDYGYEPAVEISYFATDKRYHAMPYEEGSNKTLSKIIMGKVIYHIFTVLCKEIGATIITLNSLKRAVHFYESCYFERYDTNDEILTTIPSSQNIDLIPMYYNLRPNGLTP